LIFCTLSTSVRRFENSQNVEASLPKSPAKRFELSERTKRYHSWFNPEWRQIEMYAVATEAHEVRFPNVDTAFQWQQDEKILVEISRKFDPLRLQEQLRFFDLRPVEHYTDANDWFSVLLFKKGR
jgi:L-histidine Nalpha-methyltransferase